MARGGTFNPYLFWVVKGQGQVLVIVIELVRGYAEKGKRWWAPGKTGLREPHQSVTCRLGAESRPAGKQWCAACSKRKGGKIEAEIFKGNPAVNVR